MTKEDSNAWRMVEQWSGSAFLFAGAMFVLSASITLYDIVVGAEQLRLQLGQATVGVGWIAGLIGLLGLYPRLVERNRWLMRVGVVFTVIGLVGYVIMTVGVIAIFGGVPEGDLEPIEPIFLPLMLAGSVLTFPIYGVAILRSRVWSRVIGILLVTQTVVFLANALTPTPATAVLVVLIGLILINLGVGYLIRKESTPAAYDEAGSSRDPSTG